MKNLQDFKDDLSIECHGMTTEQAVAKGICLNCKEAALQKCYSGAGVSEYYISGLCEQCFDVITQEPEEAVGEFEEDDAPAF